MRNAVHLIQSITIAWYIQSAWILNLRYAAQIKWIHSENVAMQPFDNVLQNGLRQTENLSVSFLICLCSNKNSSENYFLYHNPFECVCWQWNKFKRYVFVYTKHRHHHQRRRCYIPMEFRWIRIETSHAKYQM